jgi:hypothetical protein
VSEQLLRRCLPGGSVFEQKKHLGRDGAKQLAVFVYGGGGYLGICAGALLAGASGFDGCDPELCLIGADTGYQEGKGVATVRVTPFGKVVFKPQDAGLEVWN